MPAAFASAGAYVRPLAPSLVPASWIEPGRPEDDSPGEHRVGVLALPPGGETPRAGGGGPSSEQLAEVEAGLEAVVHDLVGEVNGRAVAGRAVAAAHVRFRGGPKALAS